MAVAVLTVSDSASIDPVLDRSGPEIRSLLQARNFSVAAYNIVPDDIHAIRAVVRAWSLQDDIHWIITTGGTGLGARDLTPEAIMPLIERHASGLVHLLLSSSLIHTPFAALSRPIAGTIGNSLIVTLPGSVKAARENLQTLLAAGVIDHALDLIRGGSGHALHSALATAAEETGRVVHQHQHSHSHRHHELIDPSRPVTSRLRESPFPLLSFDDAINLILRTIEVLPIQNQLVSPALAGHVLAADVVAAQDLPVFPTTSVDGYALRSSYPQGIYTVVTSDTHRLSEPLTNGTIYRINTGAPLPAGADAVVMVEDTRLVSTVKDEFGHDLEEDQVETLVQVPKGDNVRLPGSDVRAGDIVLKKGDILHSLGGEIGSLVFVGKKMVEVFSKPIVAILSTGNEIIDIASNIENQHDGNSWGGVWDTNRPSLQAALEGMGYKVIDLGIVPDDVDSHVKCIQEGIEKADVLLTTGGTSMGSSDLLKPVIEQNLNGTIHFGRVKMRPGKPTTFATIPKPYGDGERKVPMFALPGNPASALVTFYLFVVPALRKLGGWADARCQLPRIRVQLQDAMRLDTRADFHRVVLYGGADGIKAYSTGGQRSSRIASLSGANALVVLPEKARAGGLSVIETRQFVDAIVIGEIRSDM